MKFDFTPLKPEMQSKDTFANVIDRIASGKVVPIVGNSFTDDLVFGNHNDLVQGWARYTSYPQPEDGYSLFQIAQHHNFAPILRDDVWVKEDYTRYLKAALQHVAEQQGLSSLIRREVKDQERDLTPSQMARRLNYPSISVSSDNPLLLLADLPLPIYITTCYHDFLEVALREQMHKRPQTEICSWHEGLKNIPSVLRKESYVPSVEEPLVYHLHGLDSYPESLVLTEDDHLDFLAYISKDTNAIHPRIRHALNDSSLVLIGYNPYGWDFRVLFRGLIAYRTRPLASVAIQLSESTVNREYIQNYLRRADFEVIWKSPGEFIMELYEGWGGP